LLRRLPRLLALAAAPLYKRAVAAGAVLHHATQAIGAEFEILVTGGTACRPAIDDERTPRRCAIAANCATPI